MKEIPNYKQNTNSVLMVRPVSFRMNEETAVNNFFQKAPKQLTADRINKKAQQEFDAFVEKLRQASINVVVIQDTKKHDTPDSIFPNNWVSFHQNGTIGLFPMFAPNRRLERRKDIFDLLEEKGFDIKRIADYSPAENKNTFLEGTGSLVLDRINRKAYCAVSARAERNLIAKFCEDFNYQPVVFVANQSVDKKRLPIYHTNVMMYVGDGFATVCLSSIDNLEERKNVIENLKSDGLEIVDITEVQMNQFLGNMLQLKGTNGNNYLVMSASAKKALRADQKKTLQKYGTIVSGSLKAIEYCGGGSARCMIAEIFLPGR